MSQFLVCVFSYVDVHISGAPLIASHPHFYLGSPDYVNGVVGLSPDKEKHGILIVLEPVRPTGYFKLKNCIFKSH